MFAPGTMWAASAAYWAMILHSSSSLPKASSKKARIRGTRIALATPSSIGRIRPSKQHNTLSLAWDQRLQVLRV